MTLTLRETFARDVESITRITWSPDGRRIAAGCSDNVIRIVDTQTHSVTELHGHTQIVSSISWSPDGNRLASGSADKNVKVWDLATGVSVADLVGHTDFVRAVAWTGTNEVASGGQDDTLRLWDPTTGQQHRKIRVSGGWVLSIEPSPNRDRLAVGTGSGKVWVGAPRNMGTSGAEMLKGHSSWVDGLAWSPDGIRLISASGDKTIRVWDAEKRKKIAILEGHTEQVRSVSVSADGRLLASKADDGTVKLWDTETFRVVAQFAEARGHSYWPPSIAFHPSQSVLATVGEGLRIWDVDGPRLLGSRRSVDEVKYVAAKIALVGDSGVGKTTLGWLLAHGEYRSHESTHGQQFWLADALGITRDDQTRCEAVLWDFAGQPDYRIVHALFMDDVDLALVLFDPTGALEGVRYWLKQLSPGNRRAILIAARSDRGSLSMTEAAVNAFCESEGFTGGYVSTSARTKQGVPELIQRIRSMIDWNSMPATVTTATFKRIKEHVLKVKESATGASVLVTREELASQLRAGDPKLQFSDAEFATAVKHLATHGYVSVLRSSTGSEFILVAPELLGAVASSLILEARANDKGLGAVDENRFLRGEMATRGTERLSDKEKPMLLDAAVVLFLQHNICFRQALGASTYLIFPALINEKRPQRSEEDVVEYVSYRISGAVENVYASLVVQLGYTGTFARTNQWQNQAEYETTSGEMCGFRQTAEAEGQIDLVLYHSRQKPLGSRLFEELVEMFLRGRDVTVKKFMAVVCGSCGYRPDRAEIIRRITEGRDRVYCPNCGQPISLHETPREQRANTAEEICANDERDLVRRRTAFETALVAIKAEALRKPMKVSCFLSYAWGDESTAQWVWRLMLDLRNAGIEVILDQKDSGPAMLLTRFIEQIESADFVAIVGTPNYLTKYKNKRPEAGSVVAAEVGLIDLRLLGTDEQKQTVVPLLLEGTQSDSFPPLVRTLVSCDFRKPTDYFGELFELILTMYRIDRVRPGIAELRGALRGRAPMATDTDRGSLSDRG